MSMFRSKNQFNASNGIIAIFPVYLLVRIIRDRKAYAKVWGTYYNPSVTCHIILESEITMMPKDLYGKA